MEGISHGRGEKVRVRILLVNLHRVIEEYALERLYKFLTGGEFWRKKLS